MRSTAAAEGALGQGDVLDDFGEVQVDLQQQVLAPLTHGTENTEAEQQFHQRFIRKSRSDREKLCL